MTKTFQQPVGKSVTRKDIAQLAGVSVSVVSRALNNSGYVKKDVKDKVLEIARALGYTPNPVAMSLQQRRTHQILYYCADLHNAFNTDIYIGMMEEASRRNYMVLLNGDINFDQIRETMVDGVILQNEAHALEYDRVCGKNYFLPAVSASYGKRPAMNHSIPFVEWDLYQAMDLAISYLQGKGHKRIAHLSILPISAKHMRTFAWTERMKSVLGDKTGDYYIGVHQDDLDRIPELGEYKDLLQINPIKEKELFFEKGRIAARIFHKRQIDATAIICFNEAFAYGTLFEFHELGVRVPEDVSVLCFDGSHRREQIWPVLTAVGGQPAEQGRLLAETLINMIEGKDYHHILRVPSKILEGGSVLDISGRS